MRSQLVQTNSNPGRRPSSIVGEDDATGDRNELYGGKNKKHLELGFSDSCAHRI